MENLTIIGRHMSTAPGRIMGKPSVKALRKRFSGVADHPDTNREVRRSGRGLCAANHRARVTVTADRHDLSISHVNMLGKGNGAEDRVDNEDGDAMLAIDNKADDVNALHDAGKLVEALLKRRSAAIGVRGELADGIRMKRKC